MLCSLDSVIHILCFLVNLFAAIRIHCLKRVSVVMVMHTPCYLGASLVLVMCIPYFQTVLEVEELEPGVLLVAARLLLVLSC